MKAIIIKVDWNGPATSVVLKLDGPDAQELAERAVVGFRKESATDPQFDYLLAAQHLEPVVDEAPPGQ